MFIGDQEMFLRDTLDPASKMHRLRADEHIPGNGRIGCDRSEDSCKKFYYCWYFIKTESIERKFVISPIQCMIA